MPSHLDSIMKEAYKVGNLVYADGIWFLMHSNENKDNKDGFWKTKGEPRKIFSSSEISGWRSTFEFYVGQAPHGYKTDWVMQEYRISQRGLSEGTNAKVLYGICQNYCCFLFVIIPSFHSTASLVG
jgi:hypothetical protein